MIANPQYRPEYDCIQVLTQLNDYADGELSPELCNEIEAHLAGCEDCQIILDTLRKTLYLVQHISDEPEELPEDVEVRLFAALNLEDFLPPHRR